MSANHHIDTHPQSLKQLASDQVHTLQKEIAIQKNYIIASRNQIKNVIRNELLEWFDQDLIISNIFLFLKPVDLMRCSTVCKYWNEFISSFEFSKFYFEQSFCVSDPFVNDQNRDRIIESDSDESKDDNFVVFTNEFPMSDVDCLSCFECVLGKTKLEWKTNFYRKYLNLIAITDERDQKSNNPLSEIIDKLLEPLSQSQILKLNSILQKLNFSKLFTNSIKTKSGNVVIFNDSGLPLILTYNNSNIYLGSTPVVNIRDNTWRTGMLFFIPECSFSEKLTFADALCGLKPQVVEMIINKREKLPTAYQLFSREKRSEILLQYPSGSITDMVSLKWKYMNEEEKVQYYEEEKKYSSRKRQYIISGLE